MSVDFAPMPNLSHLTRFILVYPPDQPPAYVDPSWGLTGAIEDDRFEFSSSAPQAGNLYEADEIIWTIAEVQTYRSETGNFPTQQLHIAICTQDSTKPELKRGDPIIYIPALTSGELALNPDGSIYYGTVVIDRDAPKVGETIQDWEVERLQWFEPDSYRSRFSQAVICWCSRDIPPLIGDRYESFREL